MVLRPVRVADIHGGFRSFGSWSSVQVRAWCQCGWEGPTRYWEAGTAQLELGDLDGHLKASGHTPFPHEIPSPDGLHLACGHFHNLEQPCPVPYDSPRGRLQRAMQPTINNHDAALDRLAAIAELRGWLDEQEQQAVIGARMARATWAEMGAATGTTRQGAHNRWGPLIKRYEDAGLFDKPPGLALPHPPIDPDAGALNDARSWCRWCGHRVIMAPKGVMVPGANGPATSGRWVHHVTYGAASAEGLLDVPECPGVEPWPSNLEWPHDQTDIRRGTRGTPSPS